MRPSLSFFLGIFYALLIRKTLAQNGTTVIVLTSSTIDSVEPTSAAETTTEAPDPEPTVFTSATSVSNTETIYTSVGTAAPPIGGGATCVQDCLASAAGIAGCSSSADVRCVCSSSTFLGIAQNCFGINDCDSNSVARALSDQRVLCGAGVTTSQGGQGSSPTPSASTVAPYPTLSGLSSVTASRQATPTTFVLSSGAVLTVSGIRTTLTAGLTSVATQPAGTTSTASSNSDGGSSNNGAIGRWDFAGSMVALGLVGGVVVLL